MKYLHPRTILLIFIVCVSFLIQKNLQAQSNQILIPTLMESNGQVLNIKQGLFTQNMIRIRATNSAGGANIGEGGDMIEMVANEFGNGQFIEMERNMPGGTEVVARINTNGSAEFKSIEYPDGTIQTTAPINPIAYAAIKLTGSQLSGSSNVDSDWDAANERYVIDLSGVNYIAINFTTVVTPNSQVVNRVWTEDDGSGNLVVKFFDDNLKLTQSDFHFLVYQ